MGFDAQAVVEEGGRVTIIGVPYEVGRRVGVQVSLAHGTEDAQEPSELPAEKWIEAFHKSLGEIHARHPNTPVLTEDAMSRDSIYADQGAMTDERVFIDTNVLLRSVQPEGPQFLLARDAIDRLRDRSTTCGPYRDPSVPDSRKGAKTQRRALKGVVERF